MKRWVLLAITVIFLAGMTFLTGSDVAHNGINALDIIALLIIAFFGIAIVGALTTSEPGDDPGDI